MKMGASSMEAVIGLEIHVQLATESKIFSSDFNVFGGDANTNIGAITIAHPGTLPLISKEVVNMAMKLGLALNSNINRRIIFDRKNYFYPDLPKGYQITQDATPICIGGAIRIANGIEISLTKIHLEEDAGKSLHVADTDCTNVDLNRAGVPLVEIVTEPVIQSSEQATQCLSEIRKLVRYLKISDGNMDEGSLRCDANISVHKKGDPLGSKVEVKNMNSIRNVRRAIDFEIARQSKMLIEGEEIISETRTYNADKLTTSGMRMKEELNDYRYFPEPDISPIVIDDSWFNTVKSDMPMLPEEVKRQLMNQYQLADYDASIISEEKEIADYFFETAEYCKSYKSIVNWLMGVIKSHLNENSMSIQDFVIRPQVLAEIISLIDKDVINQTVASQQLFRHLITHPDDDPQQVVVNLNLVQDANADSIQSLIDEVLQTQPEKVKAYHNGKKGLTGLFMGQLMKKMSTGIDPKKANQLILETLNKLK